MRFYRVPEKASATIGAPGQGKTGWPEEKETDGAQHYTDSANVLTRKVRYLSRGSAAMEVEIDAETLRLARAAEEPLLELCVLALWDDQHLTFPLPARGSVTVGRTEGVDVRLGDQAISRQHVKFHVGELLHVEDLSSANGTRVRGRLLTSGETVEVNPGDAIELGRTLLVVQRVSAATRAFRIYAHDYFQARVDDECARAERGGVNFAVVRVHDGGVPRALVHQRLVAAVRPGDVVASYGPAEHELLLVDCDARAAEQRAASLLASLQQLSLSAAVGLACSPRDGRTSASLLERANAAVRGVDSHDETAPVAVSDGAMESLRRVVERIAGSSISVLITGETGVGKGVLAKELHSKSPRASGAFVALNCAELADSLLEAELFGYEKGAFTGAVQGKAGLLETADGGTLLLDEVGELPLTTQAKLLRVLEDREVRRIGSVRPRHVDLRVVACTNRDLDAESERGAFRRDLYFRLAGISLTVPPLRERTGEIEGLARAFLEQAALSAGRNGIPVFTPEALAALRCYTWPGNVRELRNVIERAVLLSDDGTIRDEHLPVERLRTTVYPKSAAVFGPTRAEAPPGLRSESGERQRLLDALGECAGNQSRAAKRLGISRRTLVTRLEAYGLPRPRKSRH
jgi:two-component system response regulator AtoC